MAIKSFIPGGSLNKRLLVLFFILKVFGIQAQQFVNGKLIHKANVPNYFGDLYIKYGDEYKNLYSALGCPFNYDRNFSRFGSIEGFDTLKHRSCPEFYRASNRIALGGPTSSDSSTSVMISFNGDTLSDFGFSLKLNTPLLKDSLYDLTFLVTSADNTLRQKFYDKNLYPYEDFKITITQSNSPNSEGDVIAIIGRKDVYGIDSSIFSLNAESQVSSSFFSKDDYFYTVVKKITGVNNGLYLTVKAKLVITNEVSSLFRRNSKPNILNCNNYILLNRGLLSTYFELKCPFKIIQSGNLCNQNNPLTLFSSNNHATDKYLWSTGDTSATLEVKKPGVYWLTKDRNGCKWIDTLIVDSVKTIANNSLIYYKCKDSSISIGLDGTNGQNSFIWNNGIQNEYITANNSGIYTRSSEINSCPIVDSFYVLDYPKHNAIVSTNYILCINDSTVLRGLVNDVEWYRKTLAIGNLQEIQIKGNNDDTIILKSFKNCWQFDTIFIKVIECGINVNDYIFIPNAFSPNNDGINDVFRVHGKYIKDLEMFIYNRWGELVFYSENPTDGWNGTYQNEIVQEGLYTVVLKIKSIHQSTDITPKSHLKTTIHLLR